MIAALEEAVPPSPPLKWAGGKRWLVPRLMKKLRPHRGARLVEPFVGGLAVTLGLRPRRALLNDANPHLINFYRWLQRGLTGVNGGVEMRNDAALYARNRERFNELLRTGQQECPEAALLFYYLNRTGYNGLCRFNAKGFFNVPFGRYKTIAYRNDFREYSIALKDYDLACGDFANLDICSDDVIYADPPYDVEFTSYSAGGFSWADQERLAAWLAAHPGPVVVSNQATPKVLQLYRSLGFRITTLAAPRRISCDGNRDDAREMLATRNIEPCP